MQHIVDIRPWLPPTLRYNKINIPKGLPLNWHIETYWQDSTTNDDSIYDPQKGSIVIDHNSTVIYNNLHPWCIIQIQKWKRDFCYSENCATMDPLVCTYLYDWCEREVDTRQTSTLYLCNIDNDEKEGKRIEWSFTEYCLKTGLSWSLLSRLSSSKSSLVIKYLNREEETLIKNLDYESLTGDSQTVGAFIFIFITQFVDPCVRFR